MQPYDADLLSRIPLSAQIVLHVGCGDGALAAAYRSLNPKARLLGIEPDPGLAETATRHCDQVAAIDPETSTLPFDTAAGIDCVICDESLGQVADPWALIRRYAAVLSPSGVMVIRIRNGEHWRAAESLLRGTASAQTMPPGLDAEAIQQHLEDIGLFPADTMAQEHDPEEADRFIEALSPGLVRLGIDPQAYRQRCLGSHLIWRACKMPVERLIVAGNMLDPVGGVSHVRVVHPLHALASDPSVTTTLTDRVQIVPPDGEPRVFILHRPALMGERGTRLLTALSEAGYLIITEFDDHPDHFGMMRSGGELTFTGVHAVQTSTVPLSEELRKYNDEVAIFPNAVVSLPEVSNFADPDTLTFFFGALNRENDWAPLMPAINEVAALAGGRLRFQVVHDARFFGELDTPFKTFTPTCDYDTYLRLLSEAEISFMPLADTPFNRAKSDLKFIEAASHRVVALASAVVYPNSVVNGKTGVIFDDSAGLRLALMRLVALPNLARRLADAARQHVLEERMMAYQVQSRIAWYRSLWERREDLEQSRRMRLARYAGLAA